MEDFNPYQPSLNIFQTRLTIFLPISSFFIFNFANVDEKMKTAKLMSVGE